MTRQVFDNAMTAHVWAQQKQDSGRSHNGNFYFSGRALYSYGGHYVAGYVAPGPLYLINSDTYSISTSRHVSYAQRAVPGYGLGVPDLTEIARIFDTVFFARGPGDKPLNKANQKLARERLEKHFSGRTKRPGLDTMAAIFESAGATKKEAKTRAARSERVAARKQAKEQKRQEEQARGRLLRDAVHISNTAPAETAARARAALLTAIDSGQYRVQYVLSELAEKGRDCYRAAKAADSRGWKARARACRENHKAIRAEIRRFESDQERIGYRHKIAGYVAIIRESGNVPESPGGRVTHYRELCRAFDNLAASVFARVTGGPEFVARLKTQETAARALREQAETEESAERMAQQAAARESWYETGKTPAGFYGRLSDKSGGALLRAHGVERDDSGAITGGELQTSQGARVPLPHAIRAFQFVKLCRGRGQAWAANGQRIRVGHFQIDRIDSGGNFIAGCHSINWPEIARIAAELGVLDLSPQDTTQAR